MTAVFLLRLDCLELTGEHRDQERKRTDDIMYELQR